MKRTILFAAAMITAISLTFVNCSKSDDSASVSKLTGAVTYDGSKIAAGAVVVLSSEPNAAKVVTTTVADSSGTYTFVGIADGTYYLSAKYNTENTNLKSSGMVFTASNIEAKLSGADLTSNIALASSTASGTEVIEMGTGKWTLDATHSFIGFTFPYDSANADFGGHFAKFGLDKFIFDQANPANSKIEAWVDVTSTETGAPTILDTLNRKVTLGGRDGLNGCISHTFKVTPNSKDTFFTVYNATTKATSYYYKAKAILDAVTGALIPSAKASFVSTSVAAYGDGYVAVGDLTFNGITKSTNLYFHYIKGYSTTSTSGTTLFSSFSGFFSMKALADYKISSGHVKSNPVKVTTNLQFKK